MATVDALVAAALEEASGLKSTGKKFTSIEEPIAKINEWEKIANELETESEKSEEKKTKKESDQERMCKLSMAVILDTIDDPKVAPILKKYAKTVQERSKEAFQSPEFGTVADIAQMNNLNIPSFTKTKIGKNRTLFEKLQTQPVAQLNDVENAAKGESIDREEEQ
jgi:hypothetical protein